MGLLEDASPWLAGMMQQATANAAKTITYIRGAYQISLTGIAWSTAPRFLREPAEGETSLSQSDRDYMIPAADLTHSGEEWEPQKGDRIEEAAGGVTLVFDVLPASSEPEWRWADDERTIRRVHTKEHV